MPLVPTRPSTCPGLGVGSRCSLKEFGPNRWVVSLSMFFGRLMIRMAWNGHRFTQMPHPMHSISEMLTNGEVGVTSIQSLSDLLIGQPFLHSCLHRFGLHFSLLTMAILNLLYSISDS